MKKILSLVLALLMLSALSITAAAANANTPASIADLLDAYYASYSRSNPWDYWDWDAPNPWDKSIPTSDITTQWIGTCPKDDCDGEALYYLLNDRYNGIGWYCFKCGRSGSYGSDIPSVTPSRYIDAIICPEKGCGKVATLIEKDPYFIKDGKLYATYKCSNGHETALAVGSDDRSSSRVFSITVINSYGSYGADYEIKGGETAKYDEERTIVFYAPRGCVLTDVSVNGVDAEIINGNSITFKVKSNTVVRPYYAPVASLRDYTITSTASAGGNILASKNGNYVNADKVTANRADTVTYTFRGNSINYKVSDVKIDGKSIGAPTTYTFRKLSGDHTIDVTYAWKNPYVDVDAKYVSAVEYVSESGIMGPYTQTGAKKYFSGTTGISVGDFVYAITELTDTNNILKNNDDRAKWAIDNGLIGKTDDLTANCNVQKACSIVAKYLKAIEKQNNIKFTKFNSALTDRKNAIAINLVTEKTYIANRDLNRYDLAAICKLVSALNYK